MKRIAAYNKIIICIVFAFLLGIGLATAQPVTDGNTRIVITLDSQDDKTNVINAVENNGGTFVREMQDGNLIFNVPPLNNRNSILGIPGAANIKEDVLIKIPDPIKDTIDVKENTQLTPNDPLYPQQWGMPVIGADKMWDIQQGNPQVIVAVIDTGVDYNHEDLAAVDEGLGWDFSNNDPDPMDDNGHGTHVAGIIAATINNNKGVVGVAPDVRVMPVKVCNSGGSCWTSDIADGIVWAVNHGARIISISLGGDSPDDMTSESTKWAVGKGALVLAAAGNRGIEAPEYPGAYPWVLGIGALDSSGNRAYYSQYGNWLDLVAPGSGIISTVPKGTCELCDPSGYKSLSGTSMATPHASGVATLYWSFNPGLTNKQVGIGLIKFADDLGAPGWDKYYGYGRVDAYPQDG